MRYLFRVQYTFSDGTSCYEPVCIEAATEQAARDEVATATTRFLTVARATRTVTLVLSV
jgi:hypothetical protein